ncbi:MAG: FAD-dependent oxidoreductase [Prevotella sp.]|jgi:ferredoxin-NADP reductase|nr:FAD-dependent oxidoreductase [Prevotella sp.]
MATISKATVCEIKEYGKDTREYALKLDRNNYFEPGSFLLLTLEEKDDYTKWPESRNFSIASIYGKDAMIRLVIRKTGAYTTRIFNELAVGKTCTVKYAFGDFLLPFYDAKSPVCCIAGGTGIAPVLSFAEELKKNGQESRLHVYYSFKNSEENIGVDVLKGIVPGSQLHLYSTREQLSGVNCRRIEKNDILDSGLDFESSHFYICGSEAFTACFKELLLGEDVRNIYTDEW